MPDSGLRDGGYLRHLQEIGHASLAALVAWTLL